MGLQSERGRWRYNLRGSFHWAETLIKAMQGRGDIWDAYWYAAAYKHGAVTLYPRVSLVVNNGWDGSGLHCGARPRYGIAMNLNPEWPPFPSAIDWPRQAEANQAAYRRVQKYLRRQEKLWKRRPSLLARIRGRVSPFVPDWLKTSLRMVRPKGRQPDGGDS
ncbi:hypothetical protein AAU61_01020 [Desulfocarbo indianensis]|nr:hypothetical protein AAU61_01020 [Desulfocarbo indianensis]